MVLDFVEMQLLIGIGELIEWESIVSHLIALLILTIGLYIMLFRPVKRMIQ